MTIRMAIIGFGKIARDEHVLAIAASRDFTLSAIATPGEDAAIGVPCFRSAHALFEAMAGKVDAVAVCTPPAARFAIARDALAADLDVLLEKPPATTLGELNELKRLARQRGRSIYAGWHAQHAPGVAQAACHLADKVVTGVDIRWHEDVRKWHPGQQWIWKPGGFGVFDPGINAFSIATHILTKPLLVESATLFVPENRQVPIAASIAFVGGSMKAELDWRPTANEQWTIAVDCADGSRTELRQGGSRLLFDGIEQQLTHLASYPSMYARFAELIAKRSIRIDSEPLRIVADIWLKARIKRVESFD